MPPSRRPAATRPLPLLLVLQGLLLACGGVPVGAMCEQTFECPSTQTCYTEVTGEVTFPQGFCTRSCDTEGRRNQCPDGSICALTGTRLLCAPACSVAGDCREGYRCEDVPNGGTKACVFVP